MSAPSEIRGLPERAELLVASAAVDAAVDIFYRRVLNDDLISHFFASVDMGRQIDKQKAFLTMAFGGPNHYSGIITFPRSGEWTLEIIVQITDTQTVLLSTPVPIP